MRAQATSGAAALGLLLCLASGLPLAAGPPQGAPEPVVSIPAGVNLEQALAPLQKATGYAVLSEIPTVPRKLEQGLRAAPLPEALAEISRSFHCRVRLKTEPVVRPKTEPLSQESSRKLSH